MEFKTTRELVKDLKGIDGNTEMKVLLLDMGDQAHEYMHSDKYACVRKLFSLNDICQNVFDHDSLYEAVSAHASSEVSKEVLEDAFVEALEFSDEIQRVSGLQLKLHLQNANGFAVGGISCRNQMVVGLYS